MSNSRSVIAVGSATEASTNYQSSLSLRLAVAQKWDFTAVRQRLVDNAIVSAERLAFVQQEYVRFFCCATLTNVAFSSVVSREVDAFWHEHILHTKNYNEFCDFVCGHFFHHTPVSNSASMGCNHAESFSWCKIYEAAFGRLPYSDNSENLDHVISNLNNGESKLQPSQIPCGGGDILARIPCGGDLGADSA